MEQAKGRLDKTDKYDIMLLFYRRTIILAVRTVHMRLIVTSIETC
jgi:hypothetical protein